MLRIALTCLLLFGLGSCLPVAPPNDSTSRLTKESKGPEVNGKFEELVETVDSISETLDGHDVKTDNMSKMLEGHDVKMENMSKMLDEMYNSGIDEKLEEMSEMLEKLSDESKKSHTSCFSLREAGHDKDGVYVIKPPGLTPMVVYCDMTTLGGGWTIIQKRTSSSDFYKTWAEYRYFFGDVEGNYWLGLEPIYQLTKDQNVELYVKLQDFDNDWYYARYRHFGIESEDLKYRLKVHGYSGTAGDSMGYHNGMAFTTKDRDNDESSSNCAVRYQGAWWYKGCYESNLNGIYFNTKTVDATSMNWKDIKPIYGSLKSSVMMIRPANF